MWKPENSEPRRRVSRSAAERRELLEATTRAAMAAINVEEEARRAKTERLRIIREASLAQKADGAASGGKST